MAIVNLTPHDVVVFLPDGSKKVYSRSGTVARVRTRAEPMGEVDGVPTVQIEYGEIEGLPDQPDGNYYIVSILVLQAAERLEHPLLPWLLAPDTGPESAVRDEQGRIVGVKRFVVAGWRDLE